MYSGEMRVELSFNDQQWTQQERQYEYLTPWTALSVYPTAGPTLGGTFVQVRGVGLHASATGEANPVMWRLAFVVHDKNADAQLDASELNALVEQLRGDGALPCAPRPRLARRPRIHRERLATPARVCL